METQGWLAWFFRDKNGRLTLWQFPNPALWVWLAAVVVSQVNDTAEVTGIRHGALIVWALDELVRGSSPFRRVLGAVVLTGQLVLLSR